MSSKKQPLKKLQLPTFDKPLKSIREQEEITLAEYDYYTFLVQQEKIKQKGTFQPSVFDQIYKPNR